jgi:hypothetical protein
VSESYTTKIVLKSLISDRGLYDSTGKVEAVFTVGHDNSTRTVTQDLILTNSDSGWSAQMPMQDFPKQKTTTAAAWKLAEWMEKMALAIKDNTFDSINLNDL